MLGVSLALPKLGSPRCKRFESVVDSGASRCIFHADIGRHLGLDIAEGVEESTQGISGIDMTYLHDVMLYIPGGAVTIKAGFKENLPVAGLLGMNGFFEHFVIIFDHNALSCDLQRIAHA
jgi:hypothetical protein